MGHAIPDTIKPGLWDAAAQEIPAFHESFGDMSAILSALDSDSLRNAANSFTYHDPLSLSGSCPRGPPTRLSGKPKQGSRSSSGGAFRRIEVY